MILVSWNGVHCSLHHISGNYVDMPTLTKRLETDCICQTISGLTVGEHNDIR